ncbi:hypothetical protein ABPG74_016551 [Tetrahymena malaccensis]
MDITATNEPVRFYCFVTCPYAIRVRTALELLQVPYEYNEIDLLVNQQLSPEFLKINPLHQVPVIINQQGQTISESLVCLEYLNDKYQPGLLPQDTFQRAQIRKWISYYSSIDSKKWKILGAIRKKNKEEAYRILNEIQQNLKFLSSQIYLPIRVEQNSKTFLFGSTFGMGDIAILPVLDQMIILFETAFGKHILKDNLNGKDTEALKALYIWFENAKQQPAYQKSTYKLKNLPSNPLIDELNLRNNWQFDKYYINFATRKFFPTGQIPRL